MIVGVGTDIVEIDRIEDLMAASGSAFIDRWFTPEERAYCVARSRPAAHFAARLAAKEAVAKAVQWQWTGPVPWRNIEVVHQRTGAPDVRLCGPMQASAEALRITAFRVSLSHSRHYATAVAIASTDASAT